MVKMRPDRVEWEHYSALLKSKDWAKDMNKAIDFQGVHNPEAFAWARNRMPAKRFGYTSLKVRAVFLHRHQ